ncbi:hypothetical protein BJ508DRAFT_196693, partial [Ascobolus immersus RN42]
KKTIPEGGTVVSLIFTSDQTKLSTHVGNHSYWPLFMSVGNLHSSLRAQTSSNAWVLLAQLPIPPAMRKFHNVTGDPTRQRDSEGRTRADYLCADGFIRRGYPFTAACLADYQEYSKLYTTAQNGCCMCEILPDQLGDNCVAASRNAKEHSKAV